MLSDTTMIIPTKDRQLTVLKVLDYYAGTGLHIVVADASVEPMDIKSVQREGVRVTYIHDTQTEFIDRMNRAVAMVDTPYSLFRADRRHASILGIRSARDFLMDNPDYSTAQGLWYSLKGDGIYSIYSEYAHSPVAELDDREDRVKKTMAIYTAIFYAVFRSDVFRDAIDFCSTCRVVVFFELMFHLIAMYKGKHKAIVSPYAFVVPYELCKPYGKRHYDGVWYTYDDLLRQHQDIGLAIENHFGTTHSESASLFNEALDIYYNTIFKFVKYNNYDIARAKVDYAVYFEKDFSLYAPLIVKKLRNKRVRSFSEIFKGQSDEQFNDFVRMLEVAAGVRIRTE